MPHIEKDLADKIFRDLFVPNEPQPETEHPDMVPSVQHLHGEPVALAIRAIRTSSEAACVALNGRLAGLVGVNWQVVRCDVQDSSN